jgi:hypothetical protein
VHRYGAPGGQVVNAAALCSLNVRAVAMSDTLLANLDADEATAIFAHEIAHHEHYTDAVLRKRRLAAIMLAVCLAAIPALQLATGGRYTLAIDGLFLVAVLIFVARGQQSHRAHETACDLRAVELSGDADAVIRGLTRIHALSFVPRRFSQEFERTATHPSLARRIQAIRAYAAVTESARDEPTVVATTTPGAYVALDDARSHWFEGAPADAPLDVGVLREQATSYRALAYRELGELRLVAERPRALRAADLAGRSWSVGIRDEDVARVLAALDRCGREARRSGRRAEGVGNEHRAHRRRARADRHDAGRHLGHDDVRGVHRRVRAQRRVARRDVGDGDRRRRALARLGRERDAVRDAGRDRGAGHRHRGRAVERVDRLEVASRRARRELARDRHAPDRAVDARAVRRARHRRRGLAAGARLRRSDAAALLGDPQTASAAIAVLGLGSALLVARDRVREASRVEPGGAGRRRVAAGTLGERWSTPSSADRVEHGRLSLVATVPIGSEVHEAAMSPGGTRFLTRRWVGEDDAEGAAYSRQIVTGSIPLRGPARTFTALDAVLPNEHELLVLARAGDDSLELRLERQDADSATRVAWRRVLPTLANPRLRLEARGTRWILSGHQRDGQRHRLATISGAIDGTDIRQASLPADTLRGQTMLSFPDGTALVVGATPTNLGGLYGRSLIATYFAALRGNALTWALWRLKPDGSRVVTRLRGYPTCAGSTEDDVAVCVEQGRRSTRVWRIARDTRHRSGNALAPVRPRDGEPGRNGRRVVVQRPRDRHRRCSATARDPDVASGRGPTPTCASSARRTTW